MVRCLPDVTQFIETSVRPSTLKEAHEYVQKEGARRRGPRRTRRGHRLRHTAPQCAQPTVSPYYTVNDTLASASSPTLVHEYIAVLNARARAADREAFSLGARQHEGFIRWESNAGYAAPAVT